jgi:hypothetical protein
LHPGAEIVILRLVLPRLALLGYLIATMLPSLVAAPYVASSVQVVASDDHMAGDSICVDCATDDDDDSLADDEHDSSEECLPSTRCVTHYGDVGTPLYLSSVLVPDSTPPVPLFRPPRQLSV